MDTMRQELSAAIEAGQEMEKLRDIPEFKKFYKTLTETLPMNLAINYAYKSDEVRRKIEEQMIMCSGFTNYIDGVTNSGKLAEEQLNELNLEED